MESKICDLLEWSVLNGSQIDDSLEFKYEKNRGVYAISTRNQSEPSQTPQLKIPIDLIIRNEISTEYFHINHNKLSNPNGALKLLLSKFKYDKNEQVVLDEKNLTEFFKPYVNLLPVGKETNSPFYWSKDELKLLENTNLGGSLPSKLKAILEEWKSTIDQLPSTFKQNIESDLSLYYKFNELNTDDLVQEILNISSWTSFGAYLWSSIIFTSRAFPHHIIDPKAKDGQAILLPLIDLLNHNNSTKASWAFETTDIGQYFSLKNEEILSIGQQVFNNYGAKGNEELLMGYGFVVEDNTNDSIALRVKVPLETIKSAEEYGVQIPKLDDYTHHAFLSNNKNEGSNTDVEDLKDGLLFFINRSNILPNNLIHLFSFLVKTPSETKRTLRSDLSALQNLRKALEQKQNLLKQHIEVDKSLIDPYIVNTIDIYRKGQATLYKLALSEIKSREKTILHEYRSYLLTLKKIYKRDEELSELLKQFGFNSYEDIERNDYADVVLILWLIRCSEVPNNDEDAYQAPEWLVKSYKEIQCSDYESEGDFIQLYKSLAGSLQQTPLAPFVTERNIAIASESIRLNSYVRVSNDEIILVEPFDIDDITG